MAQFHPGQVLADRFTLVGELGRGGSATVWLADDRLRNEQIALKVLHSHLADQASVVARLRREVRAADRVRHPAALVALDLHELDGVLALSMPFHRGQTLSEHVQLHGPWTSDALIRLGQRLAGALSAAHRQGVVHRDVSPANVLVDDDSTAVLTDFGLARVDGRHTRTATSVMGTPGFLAPEVLDGLRADPRADLYGLGGVLYLAATGAPPFGGRGPADAVRRQLDDDFTPLQVARPDLPAHLTRTIDALLAADPNRRPPSARDVDDLLSGRIPPRDAPTPAVAPATPPRREHLPQGTHTVVVREHARDHQRRERRRQQRRHRHSPFATLIQGLGNQLVRHISHRVLGRPLDETVPPEERLAARVAELADLPADALHVPDAIFEPRFRLVRDVQQSTALTLVQEATRAGFRAHAVDVSALSPSEPTSNVRPQIAFISITLFLAMVVPSNVASAFLVLCAGIAMAVTARTNRWRFSRERRLPLAFEPDLRPHLRRQYQHLLAAPDATPAQPPTPIAEPAAPTPPPEPVPLPQQVQARIDRLAADLATHTALPRVAIDDLNTATSRLTAERERLTARLHTLDEALSNAHSDAQVDTRLDHVQARLRRLQTLQRAGTPVAEADLRALRSEETALMADLERIEAIERQHVAVTARLLDLGAAANEARRDLFDTTTPSQPLVDVVARLKRDAKSAQQAMAEVDATGRARRAHGAQAAQR